MGPKLGSAFDESTQERRTITAVDEYRGETCIAIAATQLGTQYTRTQATRVVAEWVDLFSSGPTPITELHFVSRTPKRLFAALSGQPQLERLFVKWGDYDDLRPLQAARSLRVLRLAGASSVRDVSPLAELTALTHLDIESLRHAADLSSIGRITSLRQLSLGGDWMSPRVAHIESISWLPKLLQLEELLMHTVIVDDEDYSPLLRLPRLKAVRVMATRRMQPPIEDLQKQLPWAS
jgi:hypothetical protein